MVFTLLSVIALGGLIASCSTEEYEEFGTRKTLATRSKNNLVEHIVKGGAQTSKLISCNDSISFWVKATWTEGWFNYNPRASVSASASEVNLRILKYKRNVDPINYTESHVPPYFKVNPSAVWSNGILGYTLSMNYEIVIPDTVGEIVEYDTLKGMCIPEYVQIPYDCISKDEH